MRFITLSPRRTNVLLSSQKKLEETPLAEMKKIFYKLIEAQINIKMLAEIRDQYVLKIIDSPTVPELKDKPKMAFICVSATLLDGVLGVPWFM